LDGRHCLARATELKRKADAKECYASRKCGDERGFAALKAAAGRFEKVFPVNTVSP